MTQKCKGQKTYVPYHIDSHKTQHPHTVSIFITLERPFVPFDTKLSLITFKKPFSEFLLIFIDASLFMPFSMRYSFPLLFPLKWRLNNYSRNESIMTRQWWQNLIGHGGQWLMSWKKLAYGCVITVFSSASFPFVTALCGIFNKLKWHQMQQGSDTLTWIGKPYVQISHGFPFPTGRGQCVCEVNHWWPGSTTLRLCTMGDKKIYLLDTNLNKLYFITSKI